MPRILIAIFAFVMPFCSAFAQSEGLTRRQGYLMIWESIRRPALETSQASFSDVTEGQQGHIEITWGKRRKLLDDTPTFRPDDPLMLEDALLWIYRTRNVAEVDDMETGDLPDLREAYPLKSAEGDAASSVDAQRLIAIMTELDLLLARVEHEVSFYGEEFHGDHTAFGEVFDMNALTAAHRTLPQDTLVKVTNVQNGESVVVRINDRGPYVHGRDMDLSEAAFEKIAGGASGVLTATFVRLGDKTLVDSCADRPVAYQRRITRSVRFHRGIPQRWKTGDSFTLGSTEYFVIRSVRFPDGNMQRMQTWVSPDESFTFTPSQPGEYRFHVSTADGYGREFFMTAASCDSSGLSTQS